MVVNVVVVLWGYRSQNFGRWATVDLSPKIGQYIWSGVTEKPKLMAFFSQAFFVLGYLSNGVSLNEHDADYVNIKISIPEEM